MDSHSLSGCSILVVEEEPFVTLELDEQFRRAGAKVYAAGKLRDALHLAEHPALSAAVLNLRLGRDSTAHLCRRLAHLGIPFIIHTRYDPTEARQEWPDAPVLSKPADSQEVVRTVARLVN
jgi:CheY-like chemotaxis protein